MTPLWPFPAFPRTAPAVPVVKAPATKKPDTKPLAPRTKRARTTEPGVF